MDVLISQIFTGLSLGSILLLAALGLALTFGQMGVINMAHGEFIMVGAYTAFVLQGFVVDPTTSLLVALPLAFVVAGLLGVLLEATIIRRLYHRPLDTLLVTELQRHRCQVTVAVKGGPITSDAVWQDAHDVGMDTLAPVVLTGADTLGLPLDEMSPTVRDELRQADLVLSKGQANFETLDETGREVFHILRAKCDHTAAYLGVPRGAAVVVRTPRRAGNAAQSTDESAIAP